MHTLRVWIAQSLKCCHIKQCSLYSHMCSMSCTELYIAWGSFGFYIQAVLFLRATIQFRPPQHTHTQANPHYVLVRCLLWDLEQDMERYLLPSQLGMQDPIPSGMWAQTSCVLYVFNKSAPGLAKQCVFCWAFKGRGRWVRLCVTWALFENSAQFPESSNFFLLWETK